MNFLRAYRTLLRLCPNDYRAMFALEMQHAFEQAVEERRAQNRPSFVHFLLREFVDLSIGAATEWIAKLTGDSSARGRCLPDLRMMRPPGVPRELWFARTGLNVDQASLPEEAAQAQDRIPVLIHRMVLAIANHDFEGARRYSNEERQARHDSETNRCS